MASRQTLLFVVLLLLFGTGSNPRGEKIEEDVKVCEKETATLLCGTDEQKATHRWKFVVSRKRVPLKSRKYEQLQNGAILLVKNVENSDTARTRYITCHTHSKDMRKIIYIYKIVINCKNIQVPTGSSVRLPCKTNVPEDEIEYVKWRFVFKTNSNNKRLELVKKDGKITLSSSVKFDGRISLENQNLIINKIKMKETGIYQCIAYRKKNLHLSNPRYHYNVNVTIKTTKKPTIVDTTPAYNTRTIRPTKNWIPSTSHTISPNISASTTTKGYKFTTQTTSTAISSKVNRSMHVSTEPIQVTSSIIIQPTQGLKLITNNKYSIKTTKITFPTATFLPSIGPTSKWYTTKTKDSFPSTVENESSNKTEKLETKFHTTTFLPSTVPTPNWYMSAKTKDLFPSTVENENSNKTEKLDGATPNESTVPTLSYWLLVFIFLKLLL